MYPARRISLDILLLTEWTGFEFVMLVYIRKSGVSAGGLDNTYLIDCIPVGAGAAHYFNTAFSAQFAILNYCAVSGHEPDFEVLRTICVRRGQPSKSKKICQATTLQKREKLLEFPMEINSVFQFMLLRKWIVRTHAHTHTHRKHSDKYAFPKSSNNSNKTTNCSRRHCRP